MAYVTSRWEGAVASSLLVRSAWIPPLVAGVGGTGAATRRALRQAGLPTASLDEPDLFVPTRRVWAFAGQLARREGFSALGMAAADTVGARYPTPTGPQHRTLYDGLTAFCRSINRESSNMRLALGSLEPTAWLTNRQLLPADVEGATLVEQFMVRLIIQLVRRMAGPNWTPHTLGIRAPAVLPELREWLPSTSFRLGQPFTSWCFASAELTKPNLSGHHPQADRLRFGTAERTAPESFDDVLGELIRSYLSDGSPSVAAVAAACGVSVRTLQRRLADAGWAYSGLVERVRRDQATGLLADPTRSVTSVALATGYADPAHFSRAFRRWTGVSPTMFRRLTPGGDGGAAIHDR